MMIQTPLRLSGPLFEWNIDATDESISFDELHQRVIHQKVGGFSTADMLDEGGTPDGLSVQFDQQSLQLVRFSPDGLYFGFLCEKRRMGVMQTLHPTREPIALTYKWSRSDSDVLNFFWLPTPQQADYADIVVVTTQGIEVFRLAFEQRTAKSLRTLPVAVRLCWIEPMAGMVLVCIGQHTLQPFDLRLKAPKMPKFDLVLGRNRAIEARDVAVMTIYDATFCVHADSSNGRVSLRNISNPLQGMPECDVVIDMADKQELSGSLRLSKVDNLLVVHGIEKKLSVIYDIRHREGSLVPRLCGPSRVAHGSGQAAESSSELSWAGWECLSGSTILDSSTGKVYRIKIDMGVMLQHFLAHSPSDLGTVMRLLLRRTNCQDLIIQTLRRALLSQASSNDWAQAFSVLNHAYRQTIEAVTHKGPGQGKQATVSLQELESVLSQQSILSEKDMVSQVFHRHFIDACGGNKRDRSAGDLEATDAGSAQEALRIPLLVGTATKESPLSSAPARSPYLITVVMAYLRSLLSMQILPHKILQCFVFDICMYFQQEHTLQQLLHYHVLLDSPELVHRLKMVSIVRGCAWATQACLDMALRIRDFSVVADILLHMRQYLDIVPFLSSQREISFKLWRLLEQIENDREALTTDPDLLQHVLSEVKTWRQDASADSSQQIAPPDLENCEKWMPELGAAAGTSSVA